MGQPEIQWLAEGDAQVVGNHLVLADSASARISSAPPALSPPFSNSTTNLSSILSLISAVKVAWVLRGTWTRVLAVGSVSKASLLACPLDLFTELTRPVELRSLCLSLCPPLCLAPYLCR